MEPEKFLSPPPPPPELLDRVYDPNQGVHVFVPWGTLQGPGRERDSNRIKSDWVHRRERF